MRLVGLSESILRDRPAEKVHQQYRLLVNLSDLGSTCSRPISVASKARPKLRESITWVCQLSTADARTNPKALGPRKPEANCGRSVPSIPTFDVKGAD